MKMKKAIISAIGSLAMPLAAFAVSQPIIDSIPSVVHELEYTMTIFVDSGATVNVVGGPGIISPVTDGAGSDVEDGEVDVTVGLGADTTNTFSISVEKNGETTDSITVDITHETKVFDDGGDHTAPEPPTLDDLPELAETAEITISGQTEASANVYAYTVEGTVAGSTQADSNGDFEVTVQLEANKTNRFNVTAEDEAGNESFATQAVIPVGELEGVVASEEETEETEEEEALVTSAQQFFGDTEGHWAETYINDLFLEGVVSGRSEGIFDPNGLITRAELTKIAILATGHSTNTIVEAAPFADVPTSAWFAPYVEEANRLDVVSGYPTGDFGPNDFITRAAALKIILEAAGFGEAITETQVFTDVPKGAWFAGYVHFASKNGIVSGYPDGTFGPARNITRAEVAKVVIKVLELKGMDIACAVETADLTLATRMLSYDYPCGWELEATGGDYTSLAIVSHPEGRASLTFPAGGTSLAGLREGGTLDVVLEGETYTGQTYHGESASFLLIDVDAPEGSIVFYYEEEALFLTLRAILSTFDFKAN